MARRIVLYLIFMFHIYISTSSFVFHENSNVMFTSKDDIGNQSYFGYSTVLTTDGLFVGAPKAIHQMNITVKIQSGQAFVCPLKKLDSPKQKCNSFSSRRLSNKYFRPNYTEDMWLGASIIPLPDHSVLVTAPRFKLTEDGLEGVSYYVTSKKNRKLIPFSNNKKETFHLDGSRRSYGVKNKFVGYYSTGLFGFSTAVNKKQNTMVIGAPGLLALAGGVIGYSVPPTDVDHSTINNPYYTPDLEGDDYLGYSVESGVFERNGKSLYVGGAPRSDLGRGKVLVFTPGHHEKDALNVSAKLIGPQVGSYFGASLCCTDINGDGLDDLLVGAPTFVKNDGALPYDQGAVFIYVAKKTNPGFVLEESGYVLGSGADGARFGTAIADLGDVDGDTFRDIAIGAPYEDNGQGAVYVYRGNTMGLKRKYAQRIQPSGAKGFGWSISKGVDIDHNNCNDLAIGAYNSGTSYLYRCVPTMLVKASIKAPSLVSLQQNATTFTAIFCVSTSLHTSFGSHFKLGLTGNIIVDPIRSRAMLVEESQFNLTATPNRGICRNTTINVNMDICYDDLTSDLIRPINISFELKAHELLQDNSTKFLKEAVRLSEDSIMNVSSLVQVLIDCGDDLICNPWFNITLTPLENPFVPGRSKRFGVRLAVINEAEPAYAISMNISLPSEVKRIPEECSIDDIIMTCDIPQPFLQNQTIEWEIEMDFDFNVTNIKNDFMVAVELYDRFNDTHDNMTEERIRYVTIEVVPESSFVISGQSMQNTSLLIFRDDWDAGANVSFQHIFQITNLGPSDCRELIVHIQIPDKTSLVTPIPGCNKTEFIYNCTWSLPAKVFKVISMTLQMDLSIEGKYFEENVTYDAMSSVFISEPNYTSYVMTTTLILEPARISIWFIIGPCILIGLSLLSVLTWILYKLNFFSRTKYSKLKLNVTDTTQTLTNDAGPSAPADEEELQQLQMQGIELDDH